MPYNSKAFGIVIGRLRTEKGLTQERMSGLAGIARSHLVELENGNKTVKPILFFYIHKLTKTRYNKMKTTRRFYYMDIQEMAGTDIIRDVMKLERITLQQLEDMLGFSGHYALSGRLSTTHINEKKLVEMY